LSSWDAGADPRGRFAGGGHPVGPVLARSAAEPDVVSGAVGVGWKNVAPADGSMIVPKADTPAARLGWRRPMIDTRRPAGRPAGGTAIAALVLALVCALWTLWGIGQNLYLFIAVPDREFDWALVVYAFFCAVELVVLGPGAGLLVARRGAGRWLVLVGGVR
jgi:hypothetical protein